MLGKYLKAIAKELPEPFDNLYAKIFNPSSGQTRTTGLDFAGSGGMLWTWGRIDSAQQGAYLWDSTQGFNKYLNINSSAGIQTASTVTATSSSGISYGSASFFVGTGANTVFDHQLFEQNSRVLDIVSYTGNGSNRTVSHGLSVEPGMIWIKRSDGISTWSVYHRGAGATKRLTLPSSGIAVTDASAWNNTSATSSNFSLGTYSQVNTSGANYKAYVFAHDPSPTGIIQCGNYTGTGTPTGEIVYLGWTPKIFLVKAEDDTTDWLYMDVSTTGTEGYAKFFTTREDENNDFKFGVIFNETTFQPRASGGGNSVNVSGKKYIYMAVR